MCEKIKTSTKNSFQSISSFLSWPWILAPEARCCSSSEQSAEVTVCGVKPRSFSSLIDLGVFCSAHWASEVSYPGHLTGESKFLDDCHHELLKGCALRVLHRARESGNARVKERGFCSQEGRECVHPGTERAAEFPEFTCWDKITWIAGTLR